MLQRTHLDGPPDLAIEIVSPDSEARDWREKYDEYESAGVREYRVVDTRSEHIEAYALTSEGTYRRIKEVDGVLGSGVLEGFRLKTTWLWPETRPRVLDALRELDLPTA